MDERTLEIHLDELCSAMEDNSYEHDYHLDLMSVDILLVLECVDDEETDKARDGIDEDANRCQVDT